MEGYSRRRFLRVSGYIAASPLFGGFLLGCGGKGDPKPVLKVGDIVPDIAGRTLQGQEYRLSNLRGKNPVLIDFFATWCGPCMDLASTIEEWHEKYGPRGLEFLGVSLDRPQDIKTLRRMIEPDNRGKVRIRYQVICDGKVWDSTLVIPYGLEAIPTLCLVDKEGMLKARVVGNDFDKEGFVKQLEDMVE